MLLHLQTADRPSLPRGEETQAHRRGRSRAAARCRCASQCLRRSRARCGRRRARATESYEATGSQTGRSGGPLSKPMTKRTPRASPRRWSVATLVPCRPLSIREIAEWLVPMRSTSCSWVRSSSARRTQFSLKSNYGAFHVVASSACAAWAEFYLSHSGVSGGCAGASLDPRLRGPASSSDNGGRTVRPPLSPCL